MDYIDGIRARALLAILRPTLEANFRHIFRWYSKTFHTPLHEVDDLPIEHILLHWYECEYEALEDPEKEMLLRDLTVPKEVVIAEDDAAMQAMIANDAKRAKTRKPKVDPLAATWGEDKTIEAQVEKLKQGLAGLADDTRKKIKNKEAVRPQIEPQQEAPLQEITITRSGDNLDEDFDMPSFGPPPRKPR